MNKLPRAMFLSFKELLQKKIREERSQFIIEGWKILEEALLADAEIETVVVDESRIDSHEKKQLMHQLFSKNYSVFSASEKELTALSDTTTTQGIAAVVKKKNAFPLLENKLKMDECIIVVVDTLNDPGNLGTIIRTCDWFGADALVIGKNSVEMYNPKVVRATMGSLFHFPIVENVDSKNFLLQVKNSGFTIYSSELTASEDIREVVWNSKSIILIGSESHGISKEISALADKKIFIPKFGNAESLNAAMACGIILSHIQLNRKN